ncbi:hypothetical protein MSAN_02230600 [Mycena sanguinolenta]|uniref:Uncharacterized protein n=1 Tax=Mycena sanguinolenta TaxID=230812 RepID=A0A8H7CJE4_9AGAR|nr:hypothetical protein MSAN_02230600 [Mycena sanguinolenta]
MFRSKVIIAKGKGPRYRHHLGDFCGLGTVVDLLALLSCAGTNIVQYIVLLSFGLYSGMLLTSLLPNAGMTKLEDIVTHTTDILQPPNEERMLSDREFNLQVQLRLSRVNLTKIEDFGIWVVFSDERILVHSGKALHRSRAMQERGQIQIDILAELETEQQLLCNAKIDEMIAVLALRGASKSK